MNEVTEQPPSNSFARILADIREGQSLHELSEALVSLTQRVRQTGKSGTLTLQIKITPTSRGAGNSLIITDKLTSKLPEFEQENTIFFADDEHQLTRKDPRQKDLDFRSVPTAAPAPLREVPATVEQAVNQ